MFLATVTCLPVLLLVMAANHFLIVRRGSDNERRAELRQQPIEAIPDAAARLDSGMSTHKPEEVRHGVPDLRTVQRGHLRPLDKLLGQ